MISTCTISHFGPLEQVVWKDAAPINLLIGRNGCAKTFLLKILYSAIRTIEEHKRGNEPRHITDILSEKLYWTFQVNRLSHLIRKGHDHASLSVQDENMNSFSYRFGSSTEKRIHDVENTWPPREANSLFFPAKEVLSLFHLIKKSRNIDRMFGFDDTYLDLVQAIEIDTAKGKTYEQFSRPRKRLAHLLNGTMAFEQHEWVYKQGKSRFPIHIASEGVKKCAIFEHLLGNKYLSPESIVFIDEPEAALHPEALNEFLQIVALLAEAGLQFFIASHSYFVVKTLALLARQREQMVTMLSFEQEGVTFSDLRDGTPENPIIDESINLYEQEVEMILS